MMLEGERAFEEKRIDAAIDIFEEVRKKTKKGMLHSAATINLALIFNEKGDKEKAYELLLEIEDRIKISVADTGMGIHPQDMDNIFDKFKQVSTGIRRKTGGTGLGLAISKTIIDMHDGEIGVESEVDKGSTFWFVVPCVSM